MVRAVLLTVVLALVATFIVLNWNALAAPMSLSLGMTSVQAPLGLLMLALLALLGLVFAGWAISMLSEMRRQGRDLHAQRELADKAEASRFTELRDFIGAELQRLRNETRAAIEQNSNGLSASIGQLEDRLQHGERSLLPTATLAAPDDSRLPLRR